jgi:uncharacterized protein YuzE
VESGRRLANKLPRTLYDGESDSLYIVLSKGVDEGFIEIAPDINLELGKHGKVIGIEVLKARRVLSNVAPLLQAAT